MTSASRRNTVGILALVLVGVAIVYGLIRIGPPSEERQRRFDERRVEDIRSLARAADLHWTRQGTLPATLDVLVDTAPRELASTDPESGDPYEYRVLADASFELCASFGTDWADPLAEEFWAHRRGRHCFTLEAQEVERDDDDHIIVRSPPRR